MRSFLPTTPGTGAGGCFVFGPRSPHNSDMGKPLNPKHLKFVSGVLAGLTATEAYIKAGYKARGKSAGNNASRLLENAGVKSALAEARERANTNNGITANWYAERVKLEAEREGKGASHAARVAALKLAGDLLGVGEKHKHEVSGPNGEPLKAEHDHRFSLTPADLAATAGLLGLEPPGGGVRPDGGPQPVHPAHPAPPAAPVPPPR